MAEKIDKNLNVKAIKKIIAMMSKQGLTELDIEQEGIKIHLKKGAKEASAAGVGGTISYIPIQSMSAAPSQAAPAAAPSSVPAAEAPPAPAPAPAPAEKELATITSPMVGTYYSSPGPEAPAFINVGDALKVGQTLCIIEAMKLMNEVKAEISGKLAQILVENGQPVEFGQKLFLVEPDKGASEPVTV